MAESEINLTAVSRISLRSSGLLAKPLIPSPHWDFDRLPFFDMTRLGHAPERGNNIAHSVTRRDGPNCLDTLGIVWFEIPPRQFQIVIGLKIQPELCTVAEVQTQPKRGIGSDASPIVDDLGNPVWRNPDRFRQLVLREVVLCEKFSLQHFAGRNLCKFVLRHRRLSQ
jgi:hypothetical protein